MLIPLSLTASKHLRLSLHCEGEVALRKMDIGFNLESSSLAYPEPLIAFTSSAIASISWLTALEYVSKTSALPL